MAKTSIIGTNFLERFRASDYKNSVYAIAEILDNSVDAEANNIELITITINKKVKEIFFIDDGIGMSETILAKCVIFSEGTNTIGTKKTGFFGMGLPNSSLSQCRDFSVICKVDDVFRQNRVDFNKMKSMGELYIDDVYDADNILMNRIKSYTKIKDFKTIVHWTDLDKLDTLNPKTLKDRIERLMGRIHRYNIRNGIKISFMNYSDHNVKPDIEQILKENDPLFLTKNDQWITQILSSDKNINYSISQNPLTSTDNYYSKFLDPVDSTKLIRPLFYSPESNCETIEINFKGIVYKIQMTLAVAYRDIQKPGIRNGGVTPLGQQFGIKIKGATNYPSGNISWVRNNREIEVGNYSLFNITDVKMRFWSIELKYDTDDCEERNLIDELLGLSNSKQSLKFIPDSNRPDDCSNNADIHDKKQELIAEITTAIRNAIKSAEIILKKQANEFKVIENKVNGITKSSKIPGPTQKTYDVLISALGKGVEMNEEEKKELVKKIRKKLPVLDRKSVRDGVDLYSEIGIDNIIIYTELPREKLFEPDRVIGKTITYINIEHPFYIKVIEPLKEKGESDILASIELLISSLSRSGSEQFFGDDLDIILDFYAATAKDLRLILRKTETVKTIAENESN